MWHMPSFLTIKKPRPKNSKFEVSLGYIVGPHLNKQTSKQTTKQTQCTAMLKTHPYIPHTTHNTIKTLLPKLN